MSKASDSQVGGLHYAKYPIGPTEFCYRNQIPCIETLVIRYITRHRDKGGVSDLLKAIHCIKLLLQWEYQLDDDGIQKAEADNLKKRELTGDLGGGKGGGTQRPGK